MDWWMMYWGQRWEGLYQEGFIGFKLIKSVFLLYENIRGWVQRLLNGVKWLLRVEIAVDLGVIWKKHFVFKVISKIVGVSENIVLYC